MEEGWIIREGSRDFAGLVAYTDRYEPGAVRYDMGERANFALMPGVVAALEQLADWGVANIEATLAARNAGLSARLSTLGLTPTPDHARGPHFIGAGLPDGAPRDLVARLGAEGIYLSERGGSLRVTPHLWNDDEDFDRLIERAHELGLRVMIDMVIRHTSDRHPWFAESRVSRDNAKADWYVWADAKPDGTPPNNWLSIFGGSAWEWDAQRMQYYLARTLMEFVDEIRNRESLEPLRKPLIAARDGDSSEAVRESARRAYQQAFEKKPDSR